MEFNINAMFSDIGVGAVVGFVTGYAFKKLMKLAMALIGAYILSLFYLQQKGVITINTDKLFNLTNNIAQQVVSAGQKVLGILPGTSAFVAGFYLGFKKG
ncbi:FUN14 domain-containing protein [Thermococcus sp.]|uniref:FUN14 domain-containing protein n=2 Tax=Thermococcus sp. TaxID=35749 RepID=UPI0025EAA5CB|nr:FUN14 domain-containing protein [Thermococcus sp.]